MRAAFVFVVLMVAASCGDNSTGNDVPLAPGAPWPKFRGDARQTGRSPLHPTVVAGAKPWAFPTAKGIFSSPVVAADGTIYVGSADRYFYALHPDGTLAWKVQTGEIIDSSALLDDRGNVYVGSGDGHVYAFAAATGDPVWTFAADQPEGSAIINWFEGNVAIGKDGALYAPNDNFHVYALDRADGTMRWRTDMPDQTWSSPAIDPASGRLVIGNNALVSLIGANLWSFAADGTTAWKHSSSNGSIAASPMIAADGTVIVGGFDGYVRAIDPATNTERWTFGTRDHIYASPAELPDGTIVQPSADGTIYALDPATGALRWQFDTLEPIRSSPAVDADGRIYVGSGEGRLYVLEPDGTLRWSMQLIADIRNDLNSSPALGAEGIYLGGESGEVFGIPYDYCLGADGMADARCARAPLPTDAVGLWPTTPLGSPIPPAAAHALEANQPIVLSLVARASDRTELALVDAASLQVTLDPPAAVATQISADRRFVVVAPASGRFAPGALSVHATGNYLVDPTRDGLAMSGGTVGGTFDQTLAFTVDGAAPAYALRAPAAGGDDGASMLELYRLAAPLPTILPSYNQIGFDSLHYVAGIVEGSGDHFVAFVVGGKLDASDHAVVDPATRAVFALDVDARAGAISLANDAGFSLEVMGATLSFQHFLVAARLAADGTSGDGAALVVSTHCADIQLYGPFLAMLGLCNPDTGDLLVSGGLKIRPFGAGGVAHAPSGAGTATFAATGNDIRATLTGSTLATADHAIGLLLVDVATAKPVSLDYGLSTTVTDDGNGHVASVGVAAKTALHGSFRTYVMVDAYPAIAGTLVIP